MNSGGHRIVMDFDLDVTVVDPDSEDPRIGLRFADEDGELRTYALRPETARNVAQAIGDRLAEAPFG